MGMDVYGKNPKQNKPINEFPVYYKYKKMEEQDGEDNYDGFKQKWKELDADHRLREQYYKESSPSPLLLCPFSNTSSDIISSAIW